MLRRHGLTVLLVVCIVFCGLCLPARAEMPVVPRATQRLTTTFAPDGAHLPGNDGASWSLRLAAVGRGDVLVPTGAVAPTDDGNRVRYHRGDVTEWYARDGAGLEQGITLDAPPLGNGPLMLVVGTVGAVPLVTADDAATLTYPGGGMWRYDGLRVTDARDRLLPAALDIVAGGVRIRVDDAGATYPVTVDPFIQRQILIDPPSGGATDTFGAAVALSADGSTAIIGAPGRNGGTGGAYMYTRNGGTYSQILVLNGASASSFGSAVALSADGNTAVVGAPLYTGIDPSFTGQGLAYIYTRTGGTIGLPQVLADPSPGSGRIDAFGSAVAISADGSTVIVGASGRSNRTGAAYVFTTGSGGYSPVLAVTGNANSDSFGAAVALNLDGSVVIVGAKGRSDASGAAYIYTRAVGVYGSPQVITDPSGNVSNDFFGYGVALSADGSTAIIGTYGRNTAYAYTNSGGSYAQPQTLTASPGNASSDGFGSALVMSSDGSTVVIGASGRGVNTGAAYVFTRPGGGSYSQSQYLSASDGTTGDTFGTSVGITNGGAAAFIGAPGRNGNLGAAYVLPATPPVLTAASGTTPQTATIRMPFATSLAVSVTTGMGDPVGGVSVTFSAPASGPGGAFMSGAGVSADHLTAMVTTGLNGLAVAPAFTANTVAGNYTVSANATTSGGATTMDFNLTNTPGPPSTITAIGGGNQSAVLGSTFVAPLRAQVRDTYGNVVSGATVSFAAPTGANVPTVTFSTPPGSAIPAAPVVSGATTVTDTSGIAAITATAAGRPGTLTVAASVPMNGGGAASTGLTLTNTPAPSTLLVTGFSPPVGPVTGGTSVTIRGANFTTGATVRFGTSAPVVPTNITPTSLIVTAPATSIPGTVDLTVATPDGQIASMRGYTYLPVSGGILPQPGMHAPAGGSSGGGVSPNALPTRHDEPDSTSGTGSGGGMPVANSVPVAPVIPPTPAPQPARH